MSAEAKPDPCRVILAMCQASRNWRTVSVDTGLDERTHNDLGNAVLRVRICSPDGKRTKTAILDYNLRHMAAGHKCGASCIQDVPPTEAHVRMLEMMGYRRTRIIKLLKNENTTANRLTCDDICRGVKYVAEIGMQDMRLPWIKKEDPCMHGRPREQRCEFCEALWWLQEEQEREREARRNARHFAASQQGDPDRPVRRRNSRASELLHRVFHPRKKK